MLSFHYPWRRTPLRLRQFIFILLFFPNPSAWPAAGKSYRALDVAEVVRTRDTLKESVILAKGEISYVYACPPCPAGAMCKPCAGDHLRLKSLAGQDEIIVNFRGGAAVYASLKAGARVKMYIVRESIPQSGAMADRHGCYVFRSLAAAKKKPAGKTVPAGQKDKDHAGR